MPKNHGKERFVQDRGLAAPCCFVRLKEKSILKFSDTVGVQTGQGIDLH